MKLESSRCFMMSFLSAKINSVAMAKLECLVSPIVFGIFDQDDGHGGVMEVLRPDFCLRL